MKIGNWEINFGPAWYRWGEDHEFYPIFNAWAVNLWYNPTDEGRIITFEFGPPPNIYYWHIPPRWWVNKVNTKA